MESIITKKVDNGVNNVFGQHSLALVANDGCFILITHQISKEKFFTFLILMKPPHHEMTE